MQHPNGDSFILGSLPTRRFCCRARIKTPRPTPCRNNCTLKVTMTKSETKRPTGTHRATSHLLDFGELSPPRRRWIAVRSHHERARSAQSDKLRQCRGKEGLTGREGERGWRRPWEREGIGSCVDRERCYSTRMWLWTAPDECRRGPSDTRRMTPDAIRMFIFDVAISIHTDRKGCATLFLESSAACAEGNCFSLSFARNSITMNHRLAGTQKCRRLLFNYHDNGDPCPDGKFTRRDVTRIRDGDFAHASRISTREWDFRRSRSVRSETA